MEFRTDPLHILADHGIPQLLKLLEYLKQIELQQHLPAARVAAHVPYTKQCNAEGRLPRLRPPRRSPPILPIPFRPPAGSRYDRLKQRLHGALLDQVATKDGRVADQVAQSSGGIGSGLLFRVLQERGQVQDGGPEGGVQGVVVEACVSHLRANRVAS